MELGGFNRDSSKYSTILWAEIALFEWEITRYDKEKKEETQGTLGLSNIVIDSNAAAAISRTGLVNCYLQNLMKVEY